ncbi:MAG: hypothetical protein WBP93_17715 [Pyrinomonadaceae bacterium]
MKKIAIALAIASMLLFGSTAFAQCGNMGRKGMGRHGRMHGRMHGRRWHRRHGRRRHMMPMPKTNTNQ